MKSKEYSLNIRVPAELYERLEEFAAQQCTSKSEVSRTLLIRAMHDQGCAEYEFISLAEWAKAAKLRDGNACTRCGATDALDAHHVQPVYQGGKNTLRNAVTLCRACHRAAHTDGYRHPAHRRQLISVKLPKWLLDWLRAQPETTTGLIESALMEEHALSAPE